MNFSSAEFTQKVIVVKQGKYIKIMIVYDKATFRKKKKKQKKKQLQPFPLSFKKIQYHLYEVSFVSQAFLVHVRNAWVPS